MRGSRRLTRVFAPTASLALVAALLSGCATPATTNPTPTVTEASAVRRCLPAAPKAARIDDPALSSLTRMIVSSAENSTLDWEGQFGYLEYDVEDDAEENRGYTGGIVGFTSKTHDMLALVERYTKAAPNNPLAPFLPALREVDGSSSRAGLGDAFVAAWKKAAGDPTFRSAQLSLADSMYYRPALRAALADGLRPLGQVAYADAMIVHGPGTGADDFGGIRAAALREATPPSRGGDEKAYLDAFLDARTAAMRRERSHGDVSRIETAQRRWLDAGNLDLTTPLTWSVYGDDYRVDPPCG